MNSSATAGRFGEQAGSSVRSFRWRKTLYIAAISAAVGFGSWFGVTFVRIARQEDRDETRPADVIVVFGAAEYAGHPSPIYRARLEHALELYRRGLAPMIITSGGAAEDPRYNEGGVGRDFLVAQGVPDSRIIAETQAENTDASAERVAVIMRENNMKTCLAVSDNYHMFRVKAMLRGQGVTAFASPRQEPANASLWEHILAMVREDASYTLWKMGIDW